MVRSLQASFQLKTCERCSGGLFASSDPSGCPSLEIRGFLLELVSGDLTSGSQVTSGGTAISGFRPFILREADLRGHLKTSPLRHVPCFPQIGLEGLQLFQEINYVVLEDGRRCLS